jgi:hypothetical protein
MSQSNYNIPNQSAPAVRAQLNAVFGSIATNNSGSTAPSTTFAYQWWYDTSTATLKQRNAANSAWINIGTFDQSGGTFTPAGQRGLASQAEAETGTDNTKLMTPLRTSQAVATRAIGIGQTWQDVTSSRSSSTVYQNTTGRTIEVAVETTNGTFGRLQVSVTGTGSWRSVGGLPSTGAGAACAVIPENWYYRVTHDAVVAWAELR